MPLVAASPAPTISTGPATGQPGTSRAGSPGRDTRIPCSPIVQNAGRSFCRDSSAMGEAPKAAIGDEFKLEGVDGKVAAVLGTEAADIRINDVAVEPGTSIAYVSVSRGTGSRCRAGDRPRRWQGQGLGAGARQGAVCQGSICQRPGCGCQGQAGQLAADRSDHRPGVRRWQAVHRRPVERRVRQQAPRRSSSRSRRPTRRRASKSSHGPRCGARNPLAGADVCAVQRRRRAATSGGLHLHAARHVPGLRL